MEINFQDLSAEALDHLKERLLTIARDYEPWADGIHLSGAGDPGGGQFPFGLDEVERIDISMVGEE
jgi:hypothetical protein